MADAAQSALNPAAQEPKKSNGLRLIMLAGAIVFLGGGGAFWFLRHGGKTTEAAVQEKAPGYTVHLESFTVNLADAEESHFLRITMDLGLGHAPKGGSEKGEGGDFPTAQTRDAILSVLTAGKANVLMTPEGKAQLKHDLLQELQTKVPELDVREVYFTEFLVQR